MPALTRKLAADKLGISVATLKRMAKCGPGKVHQGRGGRRDPSLYDTDILSERLSPRRPDSVLSVELVDKLERAELALSLVASLRADLRMLSGRDLYMRGLPGDKHAEFLRYLNTWITSHVESHLRIRSKLSQIGPFC